MTADERGRGVESFQAELHGAVDREQFDYDALVAGVHQRAGRIRRRRAIRTGAAAAVLIPALAGGGALLLPDLLPGQTPVISPATTGTADDTVASTGDSAANTDEAAATTAAPQTAPWQDGELPALPGGAFEVNPDVPNAWEVPDARPTGVEALDDQGSPQLALAYPRTVPVSGLMSCDPGREGGMEPEAGQSFSYFTDESTLTIDVEVTGWADSGAALEGLRTDTVTSCTWDGLQGEPQPWPGNEQDQDYVVYEASDGRSAAIVRQGDYLVAVTVDPNSGATGDPTQVATDIAGRWADNLAALDVVHGQD